MNLLTTEEVAEKLKVSKYTIYSLIKSGKLPALRIGRSFRVHEEELNDYLHKCIITHENECDKCEYKAWCNSCGHDINCIDCISDLVKANKKGGQNDRTGN